jgi:uncharacterized protein (TIGR02246 family)
MMTNPLRADPSHEQQAVRAVVSAFEDAWNTHDPDAIAALLTEDAEWVNVVGWWWRGQSGVRQGFAWIHEGMFKSTPWHANSVSVRFPTPDTAIAIVTGTTGKFTSPIAGDQPGKRDRLSFFMVKRQGWRIVSGQNTEINPDAEPHDPVKSTPAASST